jgi:hypothetical protein
MYVSKFQDFVIKRMPEKGNEHAPTCPSYELAPSESGMGKLLGEAIIDRGADWVEVRLAFPLTRYQGHSRAYRLPKGSGEVAVARKQLSLHGLLHYLWEQAGLNRWYPRMQGKRSYAVVRKFLLRACEQIETKGLRLSERVLIPEPFQLDHAAQIATRHRQALSLLSSPEGHLHFKMMIAIGELKDLRPTTLGYQVVLKHLPDYAFLLDQTTGDRTKRTFESEFVAWNAAQVRLIVACLIHARQERCYQVDLLTIMMSSVQWIPLDHVYEKDVVDKLVAEGRAFIKPMRYETQHAGEFSNFELLDAGTRPIHLDILSPSLGVADRALKIQAISARRAWGWVWDATQSVDIPDLPRKGNNRAEGTSAASVSGANSDNKAVGAKGTTMQYDRSQR